MGYTQLGLRRDGTTHGWDTHRRWGYIRKGINMYGTRYKWDHTVETTSGWDYKQMGLPTDGIYTITCGCDYILMGYTQLGLRRDVTTHG